MKSFLSRPLMLIASVALAIAALALELPAHVAHAASPSSALVCVSASHTGGSMTTLTQKSLTITCPGAALGDFISVAPGANMLLLTVTGYVSAANTITVVILNGSAGSITDPTTTYAVKDTSFAVQPVDNGQ